MVLSTVGSAYACLTAAYLDAVSNRTGFQFTWSPSDKPPATMQLNGTRFFPEQLLGGIGAAFTSRAAVHHYC